MGTIAGLDTIERVAQVGTALTTYWFRGQPRRFPRLLPRAHRNDKGVYFEAHRAREFRRQAPAIAQSVPPEDDHLGWLVLMQHHRLPTRLLDWSESILVALYFAVCSDFNENGELWCLKPHVQPLREGLDEYEQDRLLVFGEVPRDRLERMAENAFLGDRFTSDVLWFLPPMRFTRMVAQRSAFTIHPSPLAAVEDGERIVGLDADELLQPHALVCYPIQADQKRRLLRDLAALGVTAGALFPDLDHLSESIVDLAGFELEEQREAYLENRSFFDDLGGDREPPAWPES